MELNETWSLNHAAKVTEEELGIAAQTYSVEFFPSFNLDHLQQFPVE